MVVGVLGVCMGREAKLTYVTDEGKETNIHHVTDIDYRGDGHYAPLKAKVCGSSWYYCIAADFDVKADEL